MWKTKASFIVGGLVVAVIIFTVALWFAQAMSAPALNRADELALIPIDGKVGVVAQITAIDGDHLALQVLQGKDYSERTGISLQALRGKDYIALGGEADIKVGTIAQFDGVKTGVNSFRLNRITVLSYLNR